MILAHFKLLLLTFLVVVDALLFKWGFRDFLLVVPSVSHRLVMEVRLRVRFHCLLTLRHKLFLRLVATWTFQDWPALLTALPVVHFTL